MLLQLSLQLLALAPPVPAILVLDAGRAHHLKTPLLAAQPGQQGLHQAQGVQPVSLGQTPPPRHQQARRIDHQDLQRTRLQGAL
ncbi:hypothetical protein D3C85_1372840 [compost metagenome]